MSNSNGSSSRRRRAVTREEDVTLDDLIRDKAIRPGDELCLCLEYTKSTGEKVSFREVGHVTADGWINDEHNNTHSALDQWAYATVGRTRKLTAGQRVRLISSSDLWKQVTVNNDTLDNIRKCYVEWVLENKENKKKIDEIEEIENENLIVKSGDEEEENNEENEEEKSEDKNEEENEVDLNADTLPALRTPPSSPPPTTTTSKTPSNKTNPNKNFKTPNCKRKDFFRSPCLDTEKKKPKLITNNNNNDNNDNDNIFNINSSDINTENLDQINEELDRYERMLESISARERSNPTTSTQLSHSPPTPSNSTPINILPTGLRPELLSYLKVTTAKLGGTVAAEYSPAVTHIVTETDDSGRVLQRTLKYAQGVLAGAWVVSFPWVLESTRRGAWAAEAPFVVAGDCFSGERGVRSGGCRSLFAGMEVYFSDAVAGAVARELAAVVRFGGGVVLEDLPAAEELTAEKIVHPSVVVVAPSTLDERRGNELYLRCGRRPVSYKWIMDSVSGRALADLGGYEITHDSAMESEPSLVY